MKICKVGRKAALRFVLLGLGSIGVVIAPTKAATIERECREAVYVRHRGPECRPYAHDPGPGNPLHAACRVPQGGLWMQMANEIQACVAAGGLQKWRGKQ